MNALHRFFVDESAVSGERATLQGDQARQIATVLRLAVGDRAVLVREGEEIEVRLDAVGRLRIDATIVERRACLAEPAVHLTLALPLLRGDRSEEVIESVAQLGVSRIVPFTSERSVVRELSGAKRERWQRIARESAETARRGRVPEVEPLVEWSRLFDVLEPPVIVVWEAERERGLTEACAAISASFSLIVGPEGGLSAEEVSAARDRGAVTASLGPRNLRSETAAIAAVARVLALTDR